MSPNERKVLAYLAERYGDYDGGCFLSFRPIASNTGLDKRRVRLACRSLKRKGFAQFLIGLMNDEGELAGAGYAATEAGLAFVKRNECNAINDLTN